MAKNAIIVYEDDEIYPSVKAMMETPFEAPKKEKGKKEKKEKKSKKGKDTVAGDEFDSMSMNDLKKAYRAKSGKTRVASSYSEDDLRAMLRDDGSEEKEEKKEGKKGKKEKVEKEKEKQVEEGMKVVFKVKGKEHKGKVKSIDYEKGKVKVKSKTDGKTYSVDPDELSI